MPSKVNRLCSTRIICTRSRLFSTGREGKWVLGSNRGGQRKWFTHPERSRSTSSISSCICTIESWVARWRVGAGGRGKAARRWHGRESNEVGFWRTPARNKRRHCCYQLAVVGQSCGLLRRSVVLPDVNRYLGRQQYVICCYYYDDGNELESGPVWGCFRLGGLERELINYLHCIGRRRYLRSIVVERWDWGCQQVGGFIWILEDSSDLKISNIYHNRVNSERMKMTFGQLVGISTGFKAILVLLRYFMELKSFWVILGQ